MPDATQRPTRGIRRLLQIVGVLGRRGSASLLCALARSARPGARWARRVVGPGGPTPPEHLRLALEELGATFVKLGQIVSTRGDILPPEYQAELARLQDAERPEPTAVVVEAIAAELGRPVDALYATFDQQPLATASIGQAHAAVTLDGVDVVVKVRRPGVVAQVEADLAMLRSMATWITRWTPVGRRHNLGGLMGEFADTLTAELDYVREARNAQRFGSLFAGDPCVHIPRVLWPLTTHRVLTLERIRGIKVTDHAALDAVGVDRCVLAQRAATLEMRMIFEHGFFHADPHPGNFFIEADGRIGLIDFGMVGEVDQPTRIALVQVVGSLALKDGNALVDALERLGIAGDAGVPDRLRADLMELAERALEQPLGDLSVGSLLRDVVSVVRRHHLRFPPNLALLVKTVAMSEGVGAQLDPSFRLVTVLLPFAQRLLSPP